MRSAAGSRAQVTSDCSARVQPSSPPRPGSPYPGEVSQGPDSRPKPPVRAGLHYSETAGPRPTPPSPAPARAGSAPHQPGDRELRGRGGAAAPVSRGDCPPRRAQNRPLPQRRGRQGVGGARPDAAGKAGATANAAATAAGNPSGRPSRGGPPGRRHSGDAAAGGALRDDGTTNPTLRLSALTGGWASAANRRAGAGRGAGLTNAGLHCRQRADASPKRPARHWTPEFSGPFASRARRDSGCWRFRAWVQRAWPAGSAPTPPLRLPGAYPPP